MDSRQEILDAIEVMIDPIKKKMTQIQNGTVESVGELNKCNIMVNGRLLQNVQYYGDAPNVNRQYRVFIPNGNESIAFIITGYYKQTESTIAPIPTPAPSGESVDLTGYATKEWVNDQGYAKAVEVIDADEYASDTENYNNEISNIKKSIGDINSALVAINKLIGVTT